MRFELNGDGNKRKQRKCQWKVFTKAINMSISRASLTTKTKISEQMNNNDAKIFEYIYKN